MTLNLLDRLTKHDPAEVSEEIPPSEKVWRSPHLEIGKSRLNVDNLSVEVDLKSNTRVSPHRQARRNASRCFSNPAGSALKEAEDTGYTRIEK